MVTVTCKCGQTTATFKHLSAADFSAGWQADCCDVADALKQASTKAPVAPVIPEASEPIIGDAPREEIPRSKRKRDKA